MKKMKPDERKVFKLQKQYGKDFRPYAGKCESCEAEFPVGEVDFGPDPFAEEIYNDKTPVWQCKECAYQSAMDI